MANSVYVPGADEYTGGGDFGILTEDEYRVRIESYKKVNRVSPYNLEGKETVDFYLTPVSYADDEDTPITDANGNDVHPEKHLVFFYDPNRLGARPMISKSRAFLAAAMNVPADGPISLPGGLDDLIGKELIAEVKVKNGKNVVSGTRPIPKRRRQRTAQAEQPDLVAAAKDVFKEDEELPF